MALADDFQAVVDSMPPDWTQLELDMRIVDEDRYVEAATLLPIEVVHDGPLARAIPGCELLRVGQEVVILEHLDVGSQPA